MLPTIYGFLISFGVVVSCFLAEVLIKRHASVIKVFKKGAKNPVLDTTLFWNTVFVVGLFAFIGARFYHVIDYFSFYRENPILIIKTWQGGMGIFGALLGGFLGIKLVAFVKAFKFVKDYKGKKPKLPAVFLAYFLTLADIFALVAPLAQAIGRWGNYFNNELFGKPTELPWALFVPFENRPEGFKLYERFHPLFLYESILNLVLFIFLLLVYKKLLIKKNWLEKYNLTGALLFLYLGGYSLIRLFVEPLRINPWTVGIVPTASLISALLLVMSLVYFGIVGFKILKGRVKPHKVISKY